MIVSIAGLKKYSGVTDNIISHRILLVHMYHLWNNVAPTKYNCAFHWSPRSCYSPAFRAHATGISTQQPELRDQYVQPWYEDISRSHRAIYALIRSTTKVLAAMAKLFKWKPSIWSI